MTRLYISLEQMDAWIGNEKIKLDGDLMTLPALGRSFRLISAVRFINLVEGDDSRKLIGRVKTDAQLQQLGGEHYAASVIFDQVGYECEEGFVGEPIDASDVAGSRIAGLS